jgi:LemA protein
LTAPESPLLQSLVEYDAAIPAGEMWIAPFDWEQRNEKKAEDMIDALVIEHDAAAGRAVPRLRVEELGPRLHAADEKDHVDIIPEAGGKTPWLLLSAVLVPTMGICARLQGIFSKNGRETMANKRFAFGCLGVVILAIIIVVLSVVGTYNTLVRLDQKVQAQWGQVENQYQRRADLVPNLVETVKGAADFEKSTFTAVTEARAKVGQVQVSADKLTPEAFAKFQEAQDGLSSALSRLLVVMEKYPDLKATENFKTLQAQLEGTENRIAVERMRFNEAAQAFNTKRMSVPTVLIAGFFGARFAEKPYFKAQPGSETAPKVKF